MNMKNWRLGSQHADPIVPGLHYMVGMDSAITVMYRHTDGEYDYGEILGTLGDISIHSARAHARMLSEDLCPI